MTLLRGSDTLHGLLDTLTRFDEDQPRWPAETPGGLGGQFMGDGLPDGADVLGVAGRVGHLLGPGDRFVGSDRFDGTDGTMAVVFVRDADGTRNAVVSTRRLAAVDTWTTDPDTDDATVLVGAETAAELVAGLNKLAAAVRRDPDQPRTRIIHGDDWGSIRLRASTVDGEPSIDVLAAGSVLGTDDRDYLKDRAAERRDLARQAERDLRAQIQDAIEEGEELTPEEVEQLQELLRGELADFDQETAAVLADTEARRQQHVVRYSLDQVALLRDRLREFADRPETEADPSAGRSTRHLPGQHIQQDHVGLRANLGDLIEDVGLPVWGGDLYLGLREDGVIDLAIGGGGGRIPEDGDPVVRMSYRDVDDVTDAMYAMWRQRDKAPGDDGLIDDTIVDTAHGRIHVGISQKPVVDEDGNDEVEEDEIPVLTLGIPTQDDTDDEPDFHDVDLIEEDLDEVAGTLQRFRDEYTPAEIHSEGLGGNYDIALLADHTVHLADDGEYAAGPGLDVAHAPALATAIRRLLEVEVPDTPPDPDDPDVVDGDDITDDVGVSLYEDGGFSLNLDSGTVLLIREEAADLAEVLDRYAALDSEPVSRRTPKLHQRVAAWPALVTRILVDDPSPPIHTPTPVPTGAMVALVPSKADAARLALDGGEPADELHLTLWYLGEAATINAETREALTNAVRSMAQRRDLPVATARGFGANYWNPTADEPAWVLAVGDPPDSERPAGQERIAVYQEMIAEAWYDGMVMLDLPAQHTPLAASAGEMGPPQRKFDKNQPRDDEGQWTDIGVASLWNKVTKFGFKYSVVAAGQPESGFAVSTDPKRAKKSDTRSFTAGVLREYRDANQDLLASKDHFIGVWRERDDTTGLDRIWLDVNAVYQDRQAAAKAARDAGQKTMFDLGDGGPLDLGGEG